MEQKTVNVQIDSFKVTYFPFSSLELKLINELISREKGFTINDVTKISLIKESEDEILLISLTEEAFKKANYNFNDRLVINLKVISELTLEEKIIQIGTNNLIKHYKIDCSKE